MIEIMKKELDVDSVLKRMFQQREKIKNSTSSTNMSIRFFSPQNGSIIRFLKDPEENLFCIARKTHYNVGTNLRAVGCLNWEFKDGELIYSKNDCPVCRLIEILKDSVNENDIIRVDARNRMNILPKVRYIWMNVFIETEFNGIHPSPKDEDGTPYPFIRILEKGPKVFDEFISIALISSDVFGDISDEDKGSRIKIFERKLGGNWTTLSFQVIESKVALTKEMKEYVKDHLIPVSAVRDFYASVPIEQIITSMDIADKLRLNYDIDDIDVSEDDALQNSTQQAKNVIQPIQTITQPNLLNTSDTFQSESEVIADLKAYSAELQEKLDKLKQQGAIV